MIKNLLLSAFATGFVGLASAQTMPAEKIVLSVAPNAANVSFAVRMTEGAGPLVCDFGEGVKTYDNVGKTKVESIKYTFATPSANERTIEIAADALTTFRVVSSRSVNGVVSVNSSVLENLNIDYTSLTAHNKIDVTNCSGLVSLTLTSTGIEEIVLPQSSKFESVQASPTDLGQGTLKKVNLDGVPNLKEIGFVGASIDTLDLTKTPKLETLVCSLPQKPLRGIKGAKNLKFLKTLDVRANALGFDQIPDRYMVEEPIENFRYSSQTTYLVAKSKIKDYTVDLSHLNMAMGIATTKQQSEFIWKYKPNATAKYVVVPADKMTNDKGKFTFDKTLSEDDTLRVYCTMSNPGYPGIGKKNANTVGTYMIKLTDTATGISAAKAEQAGKLSVVKTENGCKIYADEQVEARVYDASGKQVWGGIVPASVDLGRGVFILRTEKGESLKFAR